MKCPKCGYLGFERVERCRNCGYDFSLTLPPSSLELPIRDAVDGGNAWQDLPLAEPAPPLRIVTPDAAQRSRPAASPSEDLPLFELGGPDDKPLITRPSAPRTPLAVRRATPEVPKLRPESPRLPALDLESNEFERLQARFRPSPEAQDARAAGPRSIEEPVPAALVSRALAFVIDILILAVVDGVVVYFTMQVCGLTLADLAVLPRAPLVTFLVVQNAGYLVVFTMGGQTLGKMAAGIKVVPADQTTTLDLGHSIIRTLVWSLLAIPAGLGFLTAFFSGDHRGLHDRCAGTRVVRAT